MKKAISVFLTMVMLFMIAVPVFTVSAADDPYTIDETVPLIRIYGDSDPIYDKDGNKILEWRDLLGSDDDDSQSTLTESLANILYPFLVEGLLTDNWDNYYKNLQKEVSELLGDALLDNNGEATNGSGLSASSKRNNQNILSRSTPVSNHIYRYYYDWRLDPMETIEGLHEFVQAVRRIEGGKKVGFILSCLGTTVGTAYFAKYGYDDVCSVSFGSGVSYGSEVMSDPISGKLHIDGNAMNRFLIDCNALGMFSIPELITTTVDLLTKGGVIDTLTDVVKNTLYDKLVGGVTSALALSTFFTWPGYWACVTGEDYEDAIKYVFGAEGSEKRTQYAGLIEKIERYHNEVFENIEDIMKGIKQNGLNLCILAKYGFQMGPIISEPDKVGDQLASVEKASFGATTSSIYTTFSDEYIAMREAQGKGKYISPDKQIDASTCMYPDYTFFIKGVSHSDWGNEEQLMYEFARATRQLTIDDYADSYTQFMRFDYYDEVTDGKLGMTQPLTPENCHTENWTAYEKYDEPTNKHSRLFSFLISLFNWLRVVFKAIFK